MVSGIDRYSHLARAINQYRPYTTTRHVKVFAQNLLAGLFFEGKMIIKKIGSLFKHIAVSLLSLVVRFRGVGHYQEQHTTAATAY